MNTFYKNNRSLMILILLLVSVPEIILSQGTISGRVIDENSTPLIGANVILKNTFIGTATDTKGLFRFTKLPEGSYIVEITMIGYKKYNSDTIRVSGGLNKLEIILEKSIYKYDPVIISAGKYKQKLSDLPVSASTINASIISERNFTRLDDALRYVPGIHVTLDQVSIRGSSGYSRGAGTRVLMAIDGIPLYTGDTGELIWELIPITDVERVEIIKGAYSSLYGSTAIGGVINVITKENSSTPITLINSYLGMYDKPSHKQWNWSDQYRAFNGITAAHSNTAGKLGYSLSFSRTENNSFKMGGGFKRYSGFLKTHYNFSKISSLTFMAAGYTQNRGTFNFWKDSKNALVPPDADLNQSVNSDRIILGVTYRNAANKNLSYSIKGSLYSNHWKDESESSNVSNSNLYRVEAQTNFKINKSILLISGAEGSYNIVNSNIFQNAESKTFGVYAQADINIGSMGKLSAGTRFDFTKIDSLKSTGSVSPKLGFNYHIGNSTTLRAFAGTGFRAPTLAETFTSTTTSGIAVKPNLQLNPERNYSFETGISQIFSRNFSIDLSLFQSEYFDLIEPTLLVENNNSFVRFENVTRARIQGAEVNGLFAILKDRLKIKLGYSYLWARNINENKSLKYRPRNTLYSNFEFKSGIFLIGSDFRYSSKVEEIDWELVDLGLVKDGDKIVDVYVWDIHAGVKLFSLGIPANINVNINNLLNYNYVEMIGNISPIRNISLNLELIF